MIHHFITLMQRRPHLTFLRKSVRRSVLKQATGRRLWADESGQTLVLAAICMVILTGMLGLSIDAGVLRYQKRQLQIMADASALAAALEVSACAGTTTCSAMQTAAKDALTENGLTSTVLTNCATRSGTTLELTVNNPPCAVSSDPDSGNSNFVETVVSEPVPTTFARLFGVNSVVILARAEAFKPLSPCVYFLSQKSSQPSLTLTNQTISATCAFYLGLSYTFSSGSSSTGSPYLVAGPSSSSTGTVSPTPTFNSPIMSDPLSGLVAPSYGSCTQKNYSVTTSQNLPSGTYCGTLTIGQSSGSAITVTLSGTYVILGQLSINNAILSGSGVTFYLSQGNGYSYGASTISNINATLSAPTSGSLQGILYYVDSGLPSGKAGLSVSNWNANTRLDGILYLPGQELAASNVTLQGTKYFGVVADYAAINNTNFSPSTNYSSLANGTPFTTPSKAVAIVQ